MTALRDPPSVASPMTASLDVIIVARDGRFVDILSALMRRRGWREHRLDPAQLIAGVPRPMLARLRPDVVLVEPEAGEDPSWVTTAVAQLPGLPFVVCAQRSSAAERIAGLRAGVEHWLTKPVASEELLATLEVVVRHRRTPPFVAEGGASSVIETGELRIDPLARLCTVRGTLLAFTVKEFGVLTYLATRRGRIVARAEVFAAIWGWTMLERDRTIDVYVRRLRTKLDGASPGWSYIQTHKGRGYRFEALAREEGTP